MSHLFCYYLCSACLALGISAQSLDFTAVKKSSDFNLTTQNLNITIPEAAQDLNKTSETTLDRNQTATTHGHITKGENAFCVQYTVSSIVKPKTSKSRLKTKTTMKQEPQCTESGATLDQLIKFIGYKFDQHKCGNPVSTRKHTEALYCSIWNTHMHCLQPEKKEQESWNTEIVPQISAVEDAINVLCAVNHSLARECMFKRLKNVVRCVKTDVNLVLQLQNKQWTYGAMDTCRHLDLQIMCMWEELEPCEEETAALMTRIIGVTLRPEACPLSGAPRHMHSMCWCFGNFIVAVVSIAVLF